MIKATGIRGKDRKERLSDTQTCLRAVHSVSTGIAEHTRGSKESLGPVRALSKRHQRARDIVQELPAHGALGQAAPARPHPGCLLLHVQRARKDGASELLFARRHQHVWLQAD